MAIQPVDFSNPENPALLWCKKAADANPDLIPLVTLFQLSGDQRNYAPLLPLLFRYEGKQVTLEKHFPFEVCFDMDMVMLMVKMCARQTGKTFHNVLEMIIESVMVDNYKTLYVMPFFEMIRRLSSIYIQPMIEDSPVKKMLIDRKAANQVLQRSFPNKSTIVLAYAYNDANRVRGLSARKIRIDEVQLTLLDVIDVIQRTMDGSEHGNYEVYSGTPLTLNGTLQHKWKESSQSEWVIPCRNKTCKKENICSVEYDLEKMIGPWRPDISPERPGIICAKCKEPIFVQDGHWQSRYPDRWFTKRGIHIPQPIMPWHNQSQTRWAQIIQLVKDPLLPKYRLYNEVYGEPFDSGAGLLGEMDIKRAANLRIPYNVNRAKDLVQDYSYRMLAIDWGGGSLKYLDKNDAGPAPLSRTKIAVLGLSHHGTVDVLWGWENANPLDRQLETRMVLETLNRFRCNGLAYDTGNGGYFSEMIMKMQASVHTNIFRIGYGANLKQELFCRHASNPETGEGVYYTLDKTRSLILLAQAIKAGRVRFFNPYMGDEKDTLQTMGRALLSDFTNLKQEQIERAGGGSFSIITKLVGTSDDFANAVNFGTVAIWHQFGYPDINLMLDDFFTPQDAAALNDGSFILSESLSSRVKEIWEALGV